MKRVLLCALLLCLCLGAAGAEIADIHGEIPTGGRIMSIPVEADEVNPPDEKYYISETSYEDPSISVWMETGHDYNSDWLAVHIKLATPGQLRTALESRDGRDTAYGDRIARHAGAVLALNGDSFRNHRQTEGHYVVRQGRAIMTNVDSLHGDGFDVLIIDENGDFTIVQQATKEKVEAFEGEMVNVFTFGPALVVDGQPLTGIKDSYIGAQNPNQRLCIAQTGSLEYLIVATGGPENPGSTGVTLDELAQLLMTLGDVQNAYNLDGGSASTIIFQGKKINEFGRVGRKREVSDMIVFVSAWHEE